MPSPSCAHTGRSPIQTQRCTLLSIPSTVSRQLRTLTRSCSMGCTCQVQPLSITRDSATANMDFPRERLLLRFPLSRLSSARPLNGDETGGVALRNSCTCLETGAVAGSGTAQSGTRATDATVTQKRMLAQAIRRVAVSGHEQQRGAQTSRGTA